jgi:hypothetical protein
MGNTKKKKWTKNELENLIQGYVLKEDGILTRLSRLEGDKVEYPTKRLGGCWAMPHNYQYDKISNKELFSLILNFLNLKIEPPREAVTPWRLIKKNELKKSVYKKSVSKKRLVNRDE